MRSRADNESIAAAMTGKGLSDFVMKSAVGERVGMKGENSKGREEGIASVAGDAMRVARIGGVA